MLHCHEKLGSTEGKITIDKNGENVRYLEYIKVVLLHCNTANNKYQGNSWVLPIFVPKKSFGQKYFINKSYLQIHISFRVFIH